MPLMEYAPDALTVQVRRTRPSDPAVAVCKADPTTPGPLRVALTVVPVWTCMVMDTSLSPPWMAWEVRLGVGFDEAPVGVLVGAVDVAVQVATSVLVGMITVAVGVAPRTRVGMPDLLPPTGVLVGVGITTRVTGSTRVGVGARNSVGVTMGVGTAVTNTLVGGENSVEVGRTIRNAVGVGTPVVATVGIGVRVKPGAVDSCSFEVPQAMTAIMPTVRSAIIAKDLVTTLAPVVIAS